MSNEMKRKPHTPGNRPVMKGGKIASRVTGVVLKAPHAFDERAPVNRKERRAAAKLRGGRARSAMVVNCSGRTL